MRHTATGLLLLTVALSACGSGSLVAPPGSDPGGGDPTSAPDVTPPTVVWETLAHYTPIQDLAWSPDGDRLAVAVQDRLMGILDGDSGDRIGWNDGLSGRFRANNHAIAWSPDGERVAVPGHVRETTGWEIVTEFGEAGRTSDALAYRPDGTMLAGGSRPVSGGQDGCICLIVWDARTGEVLHEQESTYGPWGKFQAYVRGLAWSPDGERILAATDFGSFVYQLATGSVVLELPSAIGAAWSPDGGRLALSSTETVSIFDAEGGDELVERRLHEGEVYEVVWFPGGRRLVSAGRDGTVRVLDAATLDELSRAELRKEVRHVAVRPDGAGLAAGTGGGHVYLLPASLGGAGVRVPVDGGRIYALDVGPEGRYVATGGFDANLRIWTVSSGALVQEIEVDGNVDYLDWSPGGDWLAVGSDTVTLWRAADGVYETTLWDEPPNGLAFDPADERLAFTTRFDGLRVVDPATGALRWSVPPGSAAGAFTPAGAPRWSPDGSRIAVGLGASDDTHSRLWLADPTLPPESSDVVFDVPIRIIHALAWSPDGDYLVAAGGDSTGFLDRRAVLIDASTGEVVHEVDYASDGWLNDAGFTPDGTGFWVAGSTDRIYVAGPDYGEGDGYALKVWNVSDGELRSGVGHRGTIGGARFVGDELLSGTWSGWLVREALP